MLIFLDDERNPQDVKWETIPLLNEGEVFVCRTYVDYITHLPTLFERVKSGIHCAISFDHDLGDLELLYGRHLKECLPITYKDAESFNIKSTHFNGFLALKIFAEKALEEFSINDWQKVSLTVHSKNPIGKKKMEDYIFQVYCFAGLRACDGW